MKPNSDVMDRIVFDLASSIDSPRSLAVWLCFKHNQQELLSLPMADLATNDTGSFRVDYFITEYLKKYKGLKTNLDLPAVALEKWLASEAQCKRTNQELDSRMRDISSRASSIMFMAQRKISQILGSFDKYLLTTGCKWATGATYDILKQDAAPDNKMIRPISVTSRCLPYLKSVIEADPHWFEALTGILPDGRYSVLPVSFLTTPGSRFLTVPKSAKTDRCIAAEPTGNSFLQQGLHDYMRKRLKRFGVDLGNQTRNQLLARRAYAEGYATLDLSAASDSISRALVFELLPFDWACYMDDIRSHFTRVKSEWVHTEKFVSMGNAFCFELETLIFYAVAVAACGENSMVEVYGDDIIVPREFAPDVVETLELLGFSINNDKSFVDGNFFESCGEHYHRGIQVTPPYQKEILTHPSELIRAHNRLVRFGFTFPFDHPLRRKIAKISKWMVGNHPDRRRPLIPYGTIADTGYLVDPFMLLKAYDKNRGFKTTGFVWRTGEAPVNNESAFYAYHLRKSWYRNCDTYDETDRQRFRREFADLMHGKVTSNSVSSGHCAYEGSGHWTYANQWVPESDTMLDYGRL